MFVTASGFGHWGIIVSQNEDHRDGNSSRHGTILWPNGTYFFSEFG
jgi:hypothetical protein